MIRPASYSEILSVASLFFTTHSFIFSREQLELLEVNSLTEIRLTGSDTHEKTSPAEDPPGSGQPRLRALCPHWPLSAGDTHPDDQRIWSGSPEHWKAAARPLGPQGRLLQTL